jgi:ribosomal protein L37AE/L43A
MANLDLLDLLTEEEKQTLSKNAQDKAAQAEANLAAKQARRTAELEELGLLDETILDWVAQETVTFWRNWHCLCGSVYEGPAYDNNPTYVRYEKMRVRTFSPSKNAWIPLNSPKPTKDRKSVYRRGNYQHAVPHRVEILNSQLWSCPKCKTQAVTTTGLCQPLEPSPVDDSLSLDS